MHRPKRQTGHEDGDDDAHLMIDRAAKNLERQQQDNLQCRRREARGEQDKSRSAQPDEIEAKQDQQQHLQQRRSRF